MSFDPTKAPRLIADDPPTSTSPAHTLYLEIDLEVPPGYKGSKVEPMTAVFAPDPDKLPASAVDVILWLHGDKKFWSKHRHDTDAMPGITIQDYLKQPETQLREFILKSPKKKFLLVAPTLADRSSAGGETKQGKKIPAGGLLGDPAQAKLYLDVVLKAVNAYMKRTSTNDKTINLTAPKNLVLAAHSGGGYMLGNMTAFGGIFDKQVEEVWCFDCTYWGSISNWVKKGHAGRRLFFYSSGEGYDYKKNPKFDPKLPEGPDNPKTIRYRSGTADTVRDILDLTRGKSPPATTIEGLIEAYLGNLVKEDSTPNFVGTYGRPDGKKHYESIEKYLTQLIDSAKKNLQ
jgi:hypothetical protein